MKTYTKSSLQVIGLNGKTFSLVAGHLIGRAVRLITSIGVGTYYRELTSLRYPSGEVLHADAKPLLSDVVL